VNTIKKFEYEGTPISFEFKHGHKMINATEMAKPFKKLVGHFLALKGSKDYIILLESRYRDSNIDQPREVLKIIKGGNTQSSTLSMPSA